MEKYDLVIIGGGPAGYAAAMRGIDYGKKVCLIEKNKVGGAGVYNGALSSKTLWEIANRVDSVNQSLLDEGRSRFELSWETVQKSVNEAVFEILETFSSQLSKNPSSKRFKSINGTVI